MKLLVIGSQLSGKTTLVRYLRKNTDIPVSEIDEEILNLNNNEWPKENKYKDEVLIPQIYGSVASRDGIIFFINSAFPTELLRSFKDNDFKIILLKLSRDEINRRNAYRMEYEGYDDAMQWIDGQLANHQKIRAQGFIDKAIDATGSTADVANFLLSFED